MTIGISGRADLVEALRAGDQHLLHATAELLGFQSQPKQQRPSSTSSPDDVERAEQGGLQKDGKPAAAQEWTEFQPVAVPYWKLLHYADFGAQRTAPSKRSNTRQNDDLPWRSRPIKVPAARPLATRREVLTALRKASGRRNASFEPDLPELTDRISRGQLVDRIPMKRVRSWGASLHVIRDHSRRLTPYFSDQDFVCDVLKQIFPEYSLTIFYKLDKDQAPIVMWPESRKEAWRPPPETTGVLVLGDLGCLIADDDRRGIVRRFWMDMGQTLQEVGNRAMAMIPSRLAEFPESLGQFWIPVAWEHTAIGESLDDPLQKLLALCSAASARLEPGLLREIRRLMPGGYGRPELESYVWQHESIESQHAEAASFDSDRVQAFRDNRSICSKAKHRAAVDALIRDWHSNLDETVWFAELLTLDDESRLCFAEDVEDAVHRFLEIAALVTEGESAFTDWGAFVARAREFLDRIPADLWHHPEVGGAIHRIHEAVRIKADNEVSSGMQPRLIPAGKNEELTLAVHQSVDQFVITPSTGAEQVEAASWIGSIRTKNRQLKVSFEEPESLLRGREVEGQDPFWLAGRPPAWAHKWDRDKHGLWCSFVVGTVEQFMRWVPSGTFLMGSPEDEAGRFSDEGPQHEVMITEGFWMFETPCTQALWDAVMDENRSRFKGPNRPVENVSWHDSREFIQRLNTKLPGLELRLPTEAEWEFSCREGNQAPRYGDISNVAWFSQNSESATHDVKLKTPNALGLHDMLGNVWEWCADHAYREYSKDSETDPLYEVDRAAANRVFRGGSWDSAAGVARAACRSAILPVYRYGGLGFRCLSSSEQSQPREAAVSGSGSQRSGASQTATSELPRSVRNFLTSRKARQLTWLDETHEVRVEMPATPWLNIESDIEVVSFRRDRTPDWAVRSGRDSFGLWAEFEYRGAVQRLRWIPPGRFLMGSEAEPEFSWIKETPQHAVTIRDGFWMFDAPCTQELYQAVLGEKMNESKFRGPQRPVEQVRWNDCQAFVGRLNQEVPGLNLALPSEAQWEYCCRAGSGAERYGQIDAIAWYSDNSENETHDVKQLAPNAWGLFDMLGNVWEWCLDAPREFATAPPSQSVPTAGANRVVRGGSWSSTARYVRAAFRYAVHPEDRNVNLGFRCLSSSEPSQARGAAVSGSASQRSGTSQTATSEPPRSGEKKSGAWDRLRKLFGGRGQSESE